MTLAHANTGYIIVGMLIAVSGVGYAALVMGSLPVASGRTTAFNLSPGLALVAIGTLVMWGALR